MANSRIAPIKFIFGQYLLEGHRKVWIWGNFAIFYISIWNFDNSLSLTCTNLLSVWLVTGLVSKQVKQYEKLNYQNFISKYQISHNFPSFKIFYSRQVATAQIWNWSEQFLYMPPQTKEKPRVDSTYRGGGNIITLDYSPKRNKRLWHLFDQNQYLLLWVWVLFPIAFYI